MNGEEELSVPIFMLSRLLKNKANVVVRLSDGASYEGKLLGFDEFFNIVLGDLQFECNGYTYRFSRCLLKSDDILFVAQKVIPSL